MFIEAHSNISVKLGELFGTNGGVTRCLEEEVGKEVLRAKAALKEFLPVFPEIINRCVEATREGKRSMRPQVMFMCGFIYLHG